MTQKQPNSRMCFVCCIENPIGLKLAFYTDDEGQYIAHFRPRPEFQGYPGQLHGGIISTLLDVPITNHGSCQSAIVANDRPQPTSSGLPGPPSSM